MKRRVPGHFEDRAEYLRTTTDIGFYVIRAMAASLHFSNSYYCSKTSSLSTRKEVFPERRQRFIEWHGAQLPNLTPDTKGHLSNCLQLEIGTRAVPAYTGPLPTPNPKEFHSAHTGNPVGQQLLLIKRFC